MEDKDYLIRGTAEAASVRFFAARTTKLVAEARQRHGLSPTACAALGRLLTAGTMMGSMLKEGEELTLQVRSKGPLGGMMVVANSAGEVRGYVNNPHANPALNEKGKFDVSKAVGPGMLYVIKDLKMKEPYHGGVPLYSGEIGEDLTYYFTKSEQIPSAVSLGVLVGRDGAVRASGGCIIQLLPDVQEEVIAQLEARLDRLEELSRKIDRGFTPEDIIADLLDGMDWKVNAQAELKFKCGCSRQRMKKLLLSLGKEEVENLLAEEGMVEARCHFCNQVYRFQEEEARAIMAGEDEAS